MQQWQQGTGLELLWWHCLYLSSGGEPRAPILKPEQGKLTGDSGEVHDNQQLGHEEDQAGADDDLGDN